MSASREPTHAAGTVSIDPATGAVFAEHAFASDAQL